MFENVQFIGYPIKGFYSQSALTSVIFAALVDGPTLMVPSASGVKHRALRGENEFCDVLIKMITKSVQLRVSDEAILPPQERATAVLNTWRLDVGSLD